MITFFKKGDEQGKQQPQIEKTLTVSQLTHRIKDILESQRELKDISVRGEISNLRVHTSEHIYFTLKDDNSQISCAFFRRSNQSLDFKPEDGMEVVVYGDVGVYEIRGAYQIIIKKMRKEGVGDLHKKFLLLKEKLKREGLFDEKYKKPLPKFPKTIGVVTSIDGAALHDIVKIVRNRWPFVEIIVYPATVQGAYGAPTIIKGLQCLNQLKIDVIIVGRGGGSLEDLWCFNEEGVARAIFHSQIPVISAVGHETDFSITDFVADKRASTPSHAAEIVVPDKYEIGKKLGMQEKLLLKKFESTIYSNSQDIDLIETQMKKYIEVALKFLRQEHKHVEETLIALNPTSILKRGYGMVLKNGKPVKSTKGVKRGDKIKSIIWKGEIESVVEKVKEVG